MQRSRYCWTKIFTALAIFQKLTSTDVLSGSFTHRVCIACMSVPWENDGRDHFVRYIIWIERAIEEVRDSKRVRQVDEVEDGNEKKIDWKDEKEMRPVSE